MDSLEKITSILEEVENVKARLDEGLKPAEKKMINQIISRPKKSTIKLMGQEVKVSISGSLLKFEYKSNDNLTFAFVDIIDARGMDFNNTEKGTNDIFIVDLKS